MLILHYDSIEKGNETKVGMKNHVYKTMTLERDFVVKPRAQRSIFTLDNSGKW